MSNNEEKQSTVYGPALPEGEKPEEEKVEIDKLKENETSEAESVEKNTEEFSVNSRENDEEDSIDEYNGIDVEKLDKLSDDEAILELDKAMSQNDELIEKDYLSALLNQGERLVYYQVENIYQNEETKAYKNRFKLRKDPPVLIVRDDDENEVKFYLTENLTDELAETLKQVKRAYYGFSGPHDINMPDKFFDKVKYYIKNNPLKILATIFIVLLIISLTL